MVDRAPVDSSTKHAESLSIGDVKHRGLVACVPWAEGGDDEDAALKYSTGQMKLWNVHCAVLKDADSWVIWTHLHKREAFRGSKSHRHSRKPSNIHHCQAPSQVLKMTYAKNNQNVKCETNNGQMSNIWMSKAIITFSPRRWKSRLQPNLKSKFTLSHLFFCWKNLLFFIQ